MPSGSNEIQASMNTKIDFFLTLGLLLLAHVSFMLVVDKVNYWHPGVAVVHIVAETRGINDGELDFELTLLKLSLDNFHLCELVELFIVTSVVVFRGRQFGGKKSVNQGRFTQT